MPRKELLQNVKRIVVKIGSSSVTAHGILSRDKMGIFVRDMAALMKRGYEVVIVSSGAISAGAGRLHRKRNGLSIPEKQALAAIGQTILMNEYRQLFIEEGLDIGQILLTEDDVKNRRRFLNARNTFNALIRMGVIPIVNENDSVVVKEIKFGENDTLSAHVANIVEADLLILLSDIDGFYNDLRDPEPLAEVNDITDAIRQSASGTGSEHGSGGMATKIDAAEMILRCGEKMIIAKAGEELIVNRIIDGEKTGTLFYNKNTTLPGRKRWIAFNMEISGHLTIDKGAIKALVRDKKSLLAIGVVQIEGFFAPGDAVNIIDEHGYLVGKGIVNYTNDELQEIKGKNTNDIKEMLGTTYYDEVINRDNLIIF